MSEECQTCKSSAIICTGQTAHRCSKRGVQPLGQEKITRRITDFQEIRKSYAKTLHYLHNYVAVLVLRRKQDTFCKNNSNLEMIGP